MGIVALLKKAGRILWMFTGGLWDGFWDFIKRHDGYPGNDNEDTVWDTMKFSASMKQFAKSPLFYLGVLLVFGIIWASDPLGDGGLMGWIQSILPW